MCVEKGNDTSCNKDIHLNETSGNCQLGLAQGTIPSVKMDTLIKVYKSSQTPAMAAPGKRVVYNCFQIGVENSNDFFGFPKEESG
jgi:hypothetical protein